MPDSTEQASTGAEQAPVGAEQATAMPQDHLSPPLPVGICDEVFTEQLAYLRKLKSFIIKEGIKLDEQKRQAINFSGLNGLQYSVHGRMPTAQEWEALDSKLMALTGCLDDVQLRKFRIAQTVRFLIRTPYVLLCAAVLILLMPFIFELSDVPADGSVQSLFFGSNPLFLIFVFWTVFVGALGSIAFIVVNALGLHVDPLVDVTNERLAIVRTLIGALFALVLTLPVGYPAFRDFYVNIGSQKEGNAEQAAFILMPFLLGFSTSLVLSILNRLVESLQTFFGAAPRK